MRLARHSRTGWLLSLVAALNVTLVGYAYLYGAIDTRATAYGALRAVGIECLMLLLIWHRFGRAAWVARIAWCWLLINVGGSLAASLLGFTGNSTPPAVPYLLPVVPLFAAQLFSLLSPAVRRHVWKSARPSTDSSQRVGTDS